MESRSPLSRVLLYACIRWFSEEVGLVLVEGVSAEVMPFAIVNGVETGPGAEVCGKGETAPS